MTTLWWFVGLAVTFVVVLLVELRRRSGGRSAGPRWVLIWPLAFGALATGSISGAWLGLPLRILLPGLCILAALAVGRSFLRRQGERAKGDAEPSQGEVNLALAERVASLRSTPVAQIMTPTDRMTHALATSSIPEIMDLVRKTGHGRIPVLEEPGGRPLGFLQAKELAPFLHRPPKEGGIGDLIRDVLLIPPTEPASRLLDSFRHRRIHLAVVTGTDGRTLGVVGLGDFYSHLLGERSGT